MNVAVSGQFKSENSSLPVSVRVSKTRVLKLPNNKNTYGIFAFFKTFLVSSFFRRISLSKLLTSRRVSALVFMFCCSWTCEKNGVNLLKLYKLQRMRIEEAPTTTLTRCELTDSF